MSSCSSREIGAWVFVLVGMSCIRVFPAFFPEIFYCVGRGPFSCRAVDNIARLIPFPRQQSKAGMLRIADTEKLPRCPGITDEYVKRLPPKRAQRASALIASGKKKRTWKCCPLCRPHPRRIVMSDNGQQ